MSTIISYITGWAAGWNAAGPPVPVELQQRGGTKSSAWVILEGPVNAGQLTAWDTGEVDVEAYSIEAGERLLGESLQVTSEDELGRLLERLADICRVRGGAPPHASGAETP
jgi:hypothetical protein